MPTADEILYGTGTQGTAPAASPADAILHGTPEVKKVAPVKAPGKDGASEGDQMLKALEVGFGTSAGRSFLWQMANTPMAKAPAANLEDLPDKTFIVPIPGGPMIPVNPQIAGAVYNATKGVLEGATSPLGMAAMRVGGPLATLAKEYPLAKAAVVGMAGGFTYMMGKGTKEAFDNRKRVMDDPNASWADKLQANLEVTTSGVMTVLSALGMVEALHPQVLPKLEGKTPQEATHILAAEAADAEKPEAKAALMNAADALHETGPQPAPVLPDPAPVVTVPDGGGKTPPPDSPQESAALEAIKEPSVSGQPKEEPPKAEEKPEPTDQNLVGIKNAAIDQAMKDMGIEPGEHGETTTAKAENVKARAILEADPDAGRRLVEEITKKPRPLTPTEDFVLLNEMNRLAIERRSASAALEAARKAGDPIAEQNARIRSATARDNYIAAGHASDLVGTVNAQALALRRSMIREDYSLAEMERTLTEATKDGKLTPEQEEKVAKSQKRIEKSQTELESHEAKRLREYQDRKKQAKPDRLALGKGMLRAQIEDLTDQIVAGEKKAKEKGGLKTDAEYEKLKALRDHFKEQYDALFGDEERDFTPEEKLKKAVASKDRQIEELERQLRNREPFVPERKGPPTSDELAARQAKIDALKEEREYLRESLQPREEPTRKERDEFKTRESALDAQIAKIEQQLKDEAPFSKGAKEGVTNPKIEAKQQQLEALKQQREYLRDRLQPRPEPKTAQEKALDAYKKRTAKSTEDLLNRIKNKDVSPKPKPEPVKLDAEGERLRTEHERAKQEFQEMVVKARLEGRSLFEKSQDALVQWVRGLQLTRLSTLAKLSMASAYRTVGTPLEEAAGAGIEHMPFMGRIAAMAPRQGGINLAAEAHALTEGVTKGLQDSLQTLKTGQSDLDVMSGKGKDAAVGESDVMPRSMVDFLGSVWHSVIKAPVKRMEFTRSFEKRIAWKATQGIDVHNPLVQTQTIAEAYRDANRSVFLQDNALVDAYKRFLSRFEQVDKATGKAPLKFVATAAKVVMPFVKVPTNVIAETVEYAFGTATGSAKVAAAYARGIDKLTPEQADVIMRLMKKGSIGAVSMALGYMNYKNVGGLFQPGVRRIKKETPYGAINVMGENVPSYLLEHPALNALQVGATIHHVLDEKTKKSDLGGQDLGTAIMVSILGLGEEIPMARGMENMTKILGGNLGTKKAAIGDTIKNAVVPGAAQEAANKLDEDSRGHTIKRKQNTIMEHVQSGVPLWRENLKRNIDHSER